jgi:ankyrin repeat protein
MSMRANAIEAVVGWMDAMRRGDLDAAAQWFDPEATWTGVPAGAVCHNRQEVLDMLRESLTPCPDGTPLSDAVAFGQWNAARRLVERGATVPFREAAALGLMERVVAGAENADADELSEALWYACHGGQRAAAQHLLERGADPAWASPWDGLTPTAAARRSGAEALANWVGER